MKTRNKITILLFLSQALGIVTFSQINSGQFKQFVLNSNSSDKEALISFYSKLNYQTTWIQKDNADNKKSLIELLKNAKDIGLNEQDYPMDVYGSSKKNYLQTTQDSFTNELKTTIAAIHFFSDVAYGNIKPAFSFDGLRYTPDYLAIPSLVADHIVMKRLDKLLELLTPKLKEINVLENRIKWINMIKTNKDFKEVLVTSNLVTNTNKLLISKLYQMGVINKKDISDSMLKLKVKEAQRQFDLPPDGIIRTTLLAELNVPLSKRLMQLNLSINYYRWLSSLLKNRSAIVVNIPAAYMKVFDMEKIVLEMKMIVGKPATKTPTFTSSVFEVILYPYWNVPVKIATKELLPIIKRNKSYLSKNNYELLNSAGRIVDPYTVKWSRLGSRYFPYNIRQKTGCNNALGLLKLNFYTPFGVYLHDTPSKNLFMQNKRYFSHGCMRMEKPLELGRFILKQNSSIIDTLEQRGCLENQTPTIIPIKKNMSVITWYNPVGIDAEDKLVFYEDVYKKF